jgi:hypothetical protein
VNPSVFGQVVTFTAKVSVTAPGAGTPTGTVSFLDGTTLLGSAPPDATGSAVLMTTLPVGSHSITASYGGDPNFVGSTSSAVSQAVKQAATTTSLISSANQSILDQPVTFTATVAVSAPGAGTPTGTVTFLDGGTPFATVALNATGNATFTTTAPLSIGTHSITASYGGDTSFTGSTSSALSQQVSYNVRVLSTSISKNAPTIYLQLWDYNFAQNVSAQKLKVTAVCVVPFVTNAPPPTTCANAVQTSAVNAGTFSYVSDYNGNGPSFWYKVSTKGLTPGMQYYQMVQTDGDPVLHPVLFSD